MQTYPDEAGVRPLAHAQGESGSRRWILKQPLMTLAQGQIMEGFTREQAKKDNEIKRCGGESSSCCLRVLTPSQLHGDRKVIEEKLSRVRAAR